MSRCKNCVYWAYFRGGETTVPGRAQNACTARLVTYTGPDGEEKTAVTTQLRVTTLDDTTKTRVMIDSVPSLKYGVRTKPKDTCDLVRAKHKPRMVAEPTIK